MAPQDIPVTSLHCDRHHGLTSGAGARTEPRFDWFFDEDKNSFRLLALVQLYYPFDDKIKSIYFYMASAREVANKKLYPTVSRMR